MRQKAGKDQPTMTSEHLNTLSKNGRSSKKENEGGIENEQRPRPGQGQGSSADKGD
jgi:hypothetical protein